MKIVVTGAAGYIASLLIPELLNLSEVEKVTGVDIKQPDFTHTRFTFRKIDVRDPEISKVFSGHDYLVHLAFIVTPRGSISEIDSINILGSKNVFISAVHAGIKHIFYTSSIAAYGASPEHKLPLTEDAPLRPNKDWYYSRAKGEVEFFIQRFRKEFPEMKITIFRPAILLGPRINNPFGTLLKLPILPDFGLDTRIEWVYDSDVINAIVLAIKKGKEGIFNLGGDNPLTIKEIAEITGRKTFPFNYKLALRLLKYSARLNLLHEGYYEWVDKALRYTLWMDSSKAKRELGWQPEFDSAGAIKKFLGIN